MSSRSAWGQPGQQRETLSWKTKKKKHMQFLCTHLQISRLISNKSKRGTSRIAKMEVLFFLISLLFRFLSHAGNTDFKTQEENKFKIRIVVLDSSLWSHEGGQQTSRWAKTMASSWLQATPVAVGRKECSFAFFFVATITFYLRSSLSNLLSLGPSFFNKC